MQQPVSEIDLNSLPKAPCIAFRRPARRYGARSRRRWAPAYIVARLIVAVEPASRGSGAKFPLDQAVAERSTVPGRWARVRAGKERPWRNVEPMRTRFLTVFPAFPILFLGLIAMLLGGCGGPDFESVKIYKVFLEEAKPSLTKMNRVRVDLFHVGDPDEMLAKFKTDLLPEVSRLAKLAGQQPTPNTTQLAEIHTTLKKVLVDYAESTEKLVQRLESSKDDRDREAALVQWGESDQKFGADMASLVGDLSSYLDKQMKR